MQRRTRVEQFKPTQGYSDSHNVLGEVDGYWGEGSCNQLLLGEGMVQPFKGYSSKGTATGSRIMVQLGNTWGGIKDQTTASGSLVEEEAKNLYLIGAGFASKEGVTLQAYNSTPATISINAATEVSTDDNFTENSHGLATGSQLRLTTNAATPITSTPALTLNTTYFVINTGVNTFKLATTWANAQAGTAIDVTATGMGTITFTKGEDMTASTQLKVASEQLSDYLYQYFDSAGLARPDSPTLTIPSSVGTGYTGLIDGAISFKIAAIRDRANVGQNITSPTAVVKSVASTTSAVAVPQRKTVQIIFPAAVAGQTHWAVFATKQGFGGTGVHYRVGYRASSDPDAVWIFGIPETTVASAADRTLEFDFRDGDLLPETEWLYDYAPPGGTHFVRLENVGVVLGAFDGTIGAVSLPGFFESYHPRHLLYFPEPVTAVLHRRIDDFAYVACRNSIHVLQYVGYRGDDYPSCSISTIAPEVGIAYPHNWASGMGMIIAFIEGSGLVAITGDRTIEYEFGREVAYFTRNWTAADTVIAFDPKTRSFVCGNGTSSISYCVQSRAWGCPVYLSDYSVTGNWLAAINSRGELVVSVSGSPATAYSYHAGASRSPICSVSRWRNSGTSARSLNLYEIQASIRQGNNTEPVIIGLHQNLFKTHVRGCSTTSSSATVTVPSGTFTSSVTGKQAVLFGTDIGGSGVHYLIARLTYATATTVTMTNRSTGGSLTAQATLSNVFMLVGEDFEAITPIASIDQHLYSFYPAVQDARSYCVSVFQATDAVTGSLIEADIFGTYQDTSEAKL